MFPSVRLYGPFRHYIFGSLFLTLFAYQLSLVLDQQTPTIQTNDPRLADTLAYEELLRQKASLVLHRFGAEEHSIDLSVGLDHTTITTTTFHPSQHNTETTSELLARNREQLQVEPQRVGGTWLEEVDASPRVRSVKVCIVHRLNLDRLEQQNLRRSLAFALGIDQQRGDILTIEKM